MKKLFRIIGVISLLIGSFMYNETVETVFKYENGKKRNVTLILVESNNNAIAKNPFIYVKNNLKPNSVFIIKKNDQTKKELQAIINYIKAKGYEINLVDKE